MTPVYTRILHGAAIRPLLAALLVTSACGMRPDPAPDMAPRTAGAAPAPVRTEEGGALVLDADQRRWVETTLRALPLERKVAQMVVPWTGGAYTAVGSDEYERLRGWVQDVGVGGLIISIGAPGDMALKLNMLQGLAQVPLLVATDMEHGPGQRLESGTVLPYGMELGGGTEFPPVMGIAATGDSELARAMGRITAAEARAVGIHWDFAPVVDVNSNPANPIINVRSYGEEPERVAAMAVAHLEGLQQGGMIATAKHFPGHGDVSTDSHIELPVLDASPERLRAVELAPFVAAIRAGVASVMSAHIAYPRLTGDDTPATLSPRLLTGLLRDELGFRGLAVSDALNMGALVERHGQTGIVLQAIRAGADVLLMPLDARAVVDSVAAAVRAGRLDEARIDRSVRRILSAKAAVGLHRERYVDPGELPHRVGAPEHRAIAEDAARRSIVLLRDRDALLPLGRHSDVAVVSYAADVDPFAARGFSRTLAGGVARSRSVSLPVRPDSLDLAIAADAVRGAGTVVFALMVRPIASKGTVMVDEGVARLLREVAGRQPTLVVSFGNPYLLEAFPGVGSYVLAWGGQELMQQAAARALLGAAPVTGRLPVSIPPYHVAGDGLRTEGAAGPGLEAGEGGEAVAPAEEAAAPPASLAAAEPAAVGMDAAVLRQVDQRLERAIDEGVTPGAALAVARNGRLVRLRGYGSVDWAPGSEPVTERTLYDLASLTKAVGTTTATMLLVDDGAIALDVPIERYMPQLEDAAVGGSTVRQLLAHRSGLPAYRPFWLRFVGRGGFLRAIAAEPLAYTPGSQRVYSDLGMILLAMLVEHVADEPLDRLLERRVFGPLGMRDTGFRPLGGPPGPRARPAGRLARPEGIAPTEHDRGWRHRHLRGQVHDENAYAIGGVAGHAGLFSTAADLAIFAQMLLGEGEIDGRRIVSAGTVRAFTRAETKLGWYGVDISESAGSRFSDPSFGHTGFTGTSLWFDPQRELFVVLLTNRVNPTRERGGHVPLRRDVHDIVQQAIRP